MVIMHVWCYGLRWLPGEIASKSCVRPLFLLFEFFCSVGTLLFGGVIKFFGIFGLVGLGIQAHPLVAWLSGYRGVQCGVWLTHGDLVLNV